MRPVYRIYLEVEKITEMSKTRKERFVYEDVTIEATDFAWSYETDSMANVKRIARTIHDFAQELG